MNQLPDKLIRLNQKNNQKTTEERVSNFSLPQKKLKGSQPKITKIQAQKRSGRYNVFIDNQFAFGIDEAVLIKYQLQKGMEIPQVLQEEILAKEKIEKAYQQVLNYLSYGMRTEHELIKYLEKKNYDEEIPYAIQKLKELQLIDDLDYAKSFVRTEAKISKKGPYRIQQDLFKKGVDEKYIEQGLMEYPLEWQIENAAFLAEKYFQKQHNTSKKETINKTKRHLQSKGYDFHVIQSVIESGNFIISEEEELKSLRKLGERTWNRYARSQKNDDYDVIQKTKSYLYRKGFKSELIEQFISEMDEQTN